MRRYSAGEEAVAGYRLVGFIGKGQFGEVWRAAAPGGVEVALKIIDLHGTVGLRELAGFQCIKRLHHPNLISVNAAWLKTEAGQVLSEWPEPIAEMAYATSTKRFVAEMAQQKNLPRLAELIVAMGLGSMSLHERLQECQRAGRRGVPAAELIPLMRQAAAALDYLNKPIHDFGQGPMPLIHGDIKPQNLLLVGDMLQVCDFGLVRALETLRRKATVMGTYAYAAPELLDGAPNRASDQYCLAISYVECRTGGLPFDSTESVAQVIERHRMGTLDLSQLPPGEEVVVRRATAPAPADRFASCAQFVETLAQANHDDLGRLDETSPPPDDVRGTINAPVGGWWPGGATEQQLGERTEAMPSGPMTEAAPPSMDAADSDPARTVMPTQLGVNAAPGEYRPTVFDDQAAGAFAQTPVARDTLPPAIAELGTTVQGRRSRWVGPALAAGLLVAVALGGWAAYDRWQPTPAAEDSQPSTEIARSEPAVEKPAAPPVTPVEKPSTAPAAAKVQAGPVDTPLAPVEKPSAAVEKPPAQPSTNDTAAEKPAKPAAPAVTPAIVTSAPPVMKLPPPVVTPAVVASKPAVPTMPVLRPPLELASLNPQPPRPKAEPQPPSKSQPQVRPQPQPQPKMDDPIARDFDHGQRALANGDNDGAIDEFSKVLTAQSDHVEALRGRGRAYQARNQPGDLSRSVADLELALQKRPADAQALEWLADAYAEQARAKPAAIDKTLAEKAVDTYTRAYDLARDRISVLTGRGIAELALDRYEDALHDADLGAAINGRNARVYNLRGQAYDKQRQYNLAIEAFNKAIEIDPTNYLYWANRGMCRHNVWNSKSSLPGEKFQDTMRLSREDCQKMISLPPPSPLPVGYSGQLADAWMVVGEAFYYTDKLQDAVDAFSKAIENDPDLAAAYYQRSVAYRRTGDQARSKSDLDMTLKIDPQFLQRLKRPGSR